MTPEQEEEVLILLRSIEGRLSRFIASKKEEEAWQQANAANS
jgi:hypothetical protein